MQIKSALNKNLVSLEEVHAELSLTNYQSLSMRGKKINSTTVRKEGLKKNNQTTNPKN